MSDIKHVNEMFLFNIEIPNWHPLDLQKNL